MLRLIHAKVVLSFAKKSILKTLFSQKGLELNQYDSSKKYISCLGSMAALAYPGPVQQQPFREAEACMIGLCHLLSQGYVWACNKR